MNVSSTDISLISSIINILGAPGILLICMGAPSLVMVFIYLDHRRYEREKLKAVEIEAQREARFRDEQAKNESRHREEMSSLKEQFQAIMAAQEKRFEQVATFYEKNVYLVENYSKLSGDQAGIIQISTQVLTRLVEKIENGLYCPIIRDGGSRNGV